MCCKPLLLQFRVELFLVVDKDNELSGCARDNENYSTRRKKGEKKYYTFYDVYLFCIVRVFLLYFLKENICFVKFWYLSFPFLINTLRD